MTPEEVVSIHTSGDYLVYMIGFAPGFPYVAACPQKLQHHGGYTASCHPCWLRRDCGSRRGRIPLKRRAVGSSLVVPRWISSVPTTWLIRACLKRGTALSFIPLRRKNIRNFKEKEEGAGHNENPR